MVFITACLLEHRHFENIFTQKLCVNHHDSFKQNTPNLTIEISNVPLIDAVGTYRNENLRKSILRELR